MLNTSRASRGNDHCMTPDMGGSLMQMRRKGDFSGFLPSTRNGFILPFVIGLSRTCGVTQLDKTDDIIPLRPWDTGAPAGQDHGQLRACRTIDYRLKGYRVPRSELTRTTRPRRAAS